MGLHTRRLAPLLLGLLVAGCAQAAPPTTGPAEGGTDPDTATSSDLVQPVGGDLRLGEPWYLVGGTLEQATDTSVRLTFEADRLLGAGPVNTYSAGYSAQDTGALALEPFASTRKAGPAAEMDAESELLALLGEVDGYTAVQAGELYLFDGDVNVLVYSVTPRPPADDLTIADETQALAAAVVGLPERQAQDEVEAAEHTWRVVARDGTAFPVTEDYKVTRINATVTDGTVTETTIG
jgi:heat shock protein HslJ